MNLCELLGPCDYKLSPSEDAETPTEELFVFTQECAHEIGFIATDWQKGENNHRGYKFISATKFYNGLLQVGQRQR